MRAFKLASIAVMCGALASCAAVGPACRADNGLTWYMDPYNPIPVHETWSCDSFRRHVALALEKLNIVGQHDWRFAPGSPAKQMEGWTFVPVPGIAYILPDVNGGAPVGGHTRCEGKEIHVAVGVGPRASSMLHELAHAIQGCVADVGDEPAWGSHKGWASIGIFDAIQQFDTEAP